MRSNHRVIVGTAVAVAVAGTGYLVHKVTANGARTLSVYGVVDSLSSSVAPADRPGVVGKAIGMCDADTYYIEVGADAQCIVLNGSLGDVRASGTARGVLLAPDQAARVATLIRAGDRGGSEHTTRVVLEDDGGPVAIVALSALDGHGPAVAAAI